MKYFLLLILAFSFVVLSAQEHADGPAYVEGPVYKVINAANGPVIFWEGKAADPAQIVQSAPGLLKVYPPNSIDARLLIYLKPDGRLQEVVDLEYESDPVFRSEEDGEIVEVITSREPIRVNFANGLIFTYEDGKARAFFAGEFLTVSGGNGRYRIKTDAFEAGIAFGSEYGTNVYTYLKEK